MNKLSYALVTLGLGALAFVGGHQVALNPNIIDNENVAVEYVENSDGTYEVYVNMKDDQTVSDAPISNDGRSVLIAPDVPLGTNVGNGEPYKYMITEVEGGEIHGIAANKISNDNRGIFLYDMEVDFDVSPGDIIEVVWGAEEDEFASISKADAR